MKPSFSRRSLGLVLAVLGLAAASATLAYPERPVTMVNPYPPGGASDTIGRLFAKKLEENLGQPVIVENRPGAGTAIGAAHVANAKPDGYTLLLSANSTFTLNPALIPKLGYDAATSFEALGLIGSVDLALVVHPAVKANSVQELVAAIKTAPGQFVYGSFGNGTSSHFAGAMLNTAMGVDIPHVPYKGTAPLMADVIGGRIPYSFDTVVAASAQARGGKVRVLAVTGPERCALLPGLPTMAEAGLPEARMSAWVALVGPKGLPPAVKARLETAMAAGMSGADTLEQMRRIGFDARHAAIPDWAGMVRQETARFKAIAEKANIKLD